MTFFMVWGSDKRPAGFMGGTFLDWSQPPLGVYAGDTPEDACKAAASDRGSLSTFFAVEGFVWGLALMRADAKQLGKEGSPIETLNDRLAAAERRDAQIDRLLEKASRDQHTSDLEHEVLGDDDLQAQIDAATAEQERRKNATTE